MKPRCQPGDLAIVIKSVLEENIGLFVCVERGPTPQEVADAPPNLGILWHCTSKSDLRWISGRGKVRIAKEGIIPDDCLQPIRPRGVPAKNAKRTVLDEAIA